LDNHDMVTNFTAVAATINNIGPGLNEVGPASNFAGFSGFSKVVHTFNMIAGRLELFPMLVLFSPATWKKN
ncbi:MAG: TrkH family potassium uptake protein, partial [Clostridia bacterium]|nr:TrkH family potassium uptake protein [Clostridia bacterium]